MTSLFSSAASTLRLALAAALLLGPLVALGASYTDEVNVSKRGAGLVLFVSLQRQSMT